MSIKNIIRQLRVKVLHAKAIGVKNLSLPECSLIIAPHPDDEIIGCAGLIQKILSEGKQVRVILLTGGGKSISEIDAETLKCERRKLTLKAADVIGLPHENITFLDYPDGSVTHECEETAKLKKTILKIQPDAIFVPHWGEGWNDHLVVEKILRRFMVNDSWFNGMQLFEYCVWMWYYNIWKLDWQNAFVVKMNKEQHDKKLKAMDEYILPLAPCGKPYSGSLPSVFVKANHWNRELFFKVNGNIRNL